ncbi:hypothetical protein LTR16_003766 [Cryomyces antarcticus]|uniref:PNPLA domain-containing protein n=1 Tax=Cryomyces antarcticus TaxID=329879 RepID=A0ABR0KS90_9PEZI|nr:hypothetical protein LTR39_003047 [Cryomyces antarcticus]KAK5123446.1 hypothetical protein LTR16_003766 [Cryomyces antarcticus]
MADHHDKEARLIRRKPLCAGLRILTLDGGGIRGIIELALPDKLEDRIGLDLPLHDLFDLIVGISTGGIIALGLAMTQYNVSVMKQRFLDLAKRTFKRTRAKYIRVFPSFADLMMMMVKLWESRYKTSPLQEGLIDLFHHASDLEREDEPDVLIER